MVTVFPPLLDDKKSCVYEEDSAARLPNNDTKNTSSSSADGTIILLVGEGCHLHHWSLSLQKQNKKQAKKVKFLSTFYGGHPKNKIEEEQTRRVGKHFRLFGTPPKR